MDVEALIKAAGAGDRLGRGPKALVVLGGQTLLQRAVDTMLAVAERVLVAVPIDLVDRVSREFDGNHVEVIAGGDTRADTYRRLVEASHASWLIDHDVVHPFTSADLTRQVVSEARRCGAASAARWNAEMLYDRKIRLRATPGELVTPVKPLCLRRADALRGIEAINRLPASRRRDPGSVELLSLVGQRICLVPAPPWNFKLTYAEDLELAEALLHSGLVGRAS